MKKEKSSPSMRANLTWSTVGQIVEMGFSFVSSIILARYLGPAGRGDYAIIIIVASLLAIILGNNAFFSSLTYLIGKRGYSVAKVGGLAVWTTLLPMLLAGTLFSILPHTLLEVILPNISSQMVWLVMVWTLQLLLSSRVVAILAGIDRINLLIMMSISGVLADFFLQIYLLIIHNMRLEGALFQILLSSIFRIGLAGGILGYILGVDIWVDKKMTTEMLTYSRKYYLGSVSKSWLERADLYFVGLLVGSAAAGYYAVARGLATLVSLIEPPIRRAIIPKVGKSDALHSRHIVNRAFKVGFLLSILASCGSALLSPWVIPAIYGPEFIEAVPVFILMLPAMVFLTHLTVEVHFYYQLGKPEVVTFVVLAAAILGVPLLYIATYLWGYWGTAIAFSLSSLFRAILVIKYYLHYTKQTWWGFWIIDTISLLKYLKPNHITS